MRLLLLLVDTGEVKFTKKYSIEFAFCLAFEMKLVCNEKNKCFISNNNNAVIIIDIITKSTIAFIMIVTCQHLLQVLTLR